MSCPKNSGWWSDGFGCSGDSIIMIVANLLVFGPIIVLALVQAWNRI